MRFVAGRGTVAELLARSAAVAEMLPAGALQRRAIGKMLLARSAIAKRIAALWQRAIGKSCRQGHRGGVAGRGCRGREWEAGTATSSGKASNLPEGSTIGKTLPARGAAVAGALQRSTIGKQARKEPPRQAGKEPPRAASEQKRERQNPLS